MQVEYIKCLAFDNRLLFNRRDHSHMTRFLEYSPNHILEPVKLYNPKFCVLIDT